MRNIRIKIFCSILLILFFPITVGASSELYYSNTNYFLSKSKNSSDVEKIYVASGKKFEIDLKADTDAFYGTPISIYIKFTSSDNISCTTQLLDSSLYSLSNNTFTLLDNISEISTKKIGKISCIVPATNNITKISSDMSLTVSVESTDKDLTEEGSIAKTDKANYRFNLGVINENYINSLNNETCISSVTFDGKTLESGFKKNELNTATTKIQITKNNKNNTIYMKHSSEKNNNGTKTELKSNEVTVNLDYGLNEIDFNEVTEREVFLKGLEDYDYASGFSNSNIFVISSPGASYLINRPDTRSKVNTLSSLIISNTAINFNPELKTYIATVPNDISSVKITSTLTDSKSSYVANYGNRTVNLKEGLNDVLIKVKAENGNETTYTIKITRDKSGDTSLKSINVDDKNLIIQNSVFKYSLKVDNNVTNPKVTAVANDTRTKVEIGDIPELVEGSNLVTITTTAANGMKGIYLLEIVRDTLVSTNSNLKSLKVKDYDLPFENDKKDYTLKIAYDVKQLELEVETENEKAKYVVIGNKELKTGSVVKIKVTAEDEVTTTIYSISIEQEKKEVKFNILLVIIPASIILGVIIIVAILKKKKSSSVATENVVVPSNNQVISNTNINESNNISVNNNITENNDIPKDNIN